MTNPPTTNRQAAWEVTARLQSKNFEAYWAGGCVRDQLLRVEPKDYDVATNAKPHEIRALFPRSQSVGAAFGVVIAHVHGHTIEVATFRTDGVYSDGRRPDSIQFATAKDDAQRRDFTINGMFFNPINGELVDYVGGQKDVSQKLIRAIGDPHARFGEDHLRMMRAIRFAARFGFDIESATFAAIRNQHEKIKLISRERIGLELKGILATAHRVRGMALLAKSGLLSDIWPDELSIASHPDTPDVPSALREGWLANLPPIAAFEIALAALVHDLSRDGGLTREFWPRLQSHLMLSNDEIGAAAWINRHMEDLQRWCELSRSELKRMMSNARFPLLKELFFCVHDDAYLQAHLADLQAEGVRPEPFVTGEDLISLGATPGPGFKQWLNILYDMQLANEFADKKEALTHARALVESSPHQP